MWAIVKSHWLRRSYFFSHQIFTPQSGCSRAWHVLWLMTKSDFIISLPCLLRLYWNKIRECKLVISSWLWSWQDECMWPVSTHPLLCGVWVVHPCHRVCLVSKSKLATGAWTLVKNRGCKVSSADFCFEYYGLTCEPWGIQISGQRKCWKRSGELCSLCVARSSK